MNQRDIEVKTKAFLDTFLEKEGFILLKTEYVKEEGINYLRAYLDLTDKEREKRKQKELEEQEKKQKDLEENESEVSDTEEFDEEGPHEPSVGINDCAMVSRRLSKWLDKEDFIPDEYMLEVCSKGYLN